MRNVRSAAGLAVLAGALAVLLLVVGLLAGGPAPAVGEEPVPIGPPPAGWGLP